jgi:hypothetical protein
MTIETSTSDSHGNCMLCCSFLLSGLPDKKPNDAKDAIRTLPWSANSGPEQQTKVAKWLDIVCSVQSSYSSYHLFRSGSLVLKFDSSSIHKHNGGKRALMTELNLQSLPGDSDRQQEQGTQGPHGTRSVQGPCIMMLQEIRIHILCPITSVSLCALVQHTSLRYHPFTLLWLLVHCGFPLSCSAHGLCEW